MVIFGRLFLWPLKVVLKLVINSLIGGAVILIINAAAAGLGIMIPLKYAQCLILGVLGLPGAVLLVLLHIKNSAKNDSRSFKVYFI